MIAAKPFSVSRAEQHRRLQLCNIDPSLYEDIIDPSAFTALAIQEAALEAPLPTGVHAGQRLSIQRFPRFEERLWIRTATLPPSRVDCGDLIRFEASVADGQGIQAVETAEDLLVFDPAAPRATKSAAPEARQERFTSTRGSVTFLPDRVRGYCGPDANPIHFDPAAASAAGFRAPIIGGEQGVRYVMALIWRELQPATLDISLRFIRPIFWDDQCELIVEEVAGRWTSVSLAKNGKVATEITLHD